MLNWAWRLTKNAPSAESCNTSVASSDKKGNFTAMRRYLLPLLLLAWAGQTQAEALRCGTRLVYEGDVAAVVERLCGTPVQISHSSVWRIPSVWRYGRRYQLSDQEVAVPVETWTYNFGPQQFMRELRFEDGVLIKIKILDYGY